MQYVVFGADGYIGSYIFKQLIKNGFNTIGTSRKSQDKKVFYDILKSNIHTVISDIYDKEKTAIICIAEPNIDKCCLNRKQAYEINVTATKRLVNELLENGFQVIYFSSDNVFDGVGGNYTENSEIHPTNQYGLMKSEMEQYLINNKSGVCVLRIPKVVSFYREKQNVFTEWLEQVEAGRVRCIQGNRISFVCIEDIYQACLLVTERKLRGLYNIVGDKAYSRAELAEKFYQHLGAENIDIQECDMKQFGFRDNRPLNLSMSNLKFKTETGYQFMSMDTAIKKFLDNAI